MPVGLYHPNDSTDRLFVVEQGGVIRVFPHDSSITSTKVFLDIHDSVANGGELGLLGLAFHPRYATNGLFYVDYTRDNPLRTVISRFRVSTSNPDSADPSTEVVLLEQSQPFDNHNGGQLEFGPDGYLYVAFGDGGSSGDPLGNGQNRSTLLGKIVRINVDSTFGMQRYTIPPDNPFYGDTTKKQEIFAYGLRNPWRFSFDQQTLWCADVGQNTWEEIDTIVGGKNYGWNIMEGMHCYDPPSGCEPSGLSLPIWEYGHDNGRCSVTGGFVYRGFAMTSLTGKYIYGDFCTGEIWALTPAPSSLPSNSFLVGTGTQISSFGEDRFQNIYVCDYGGGKIYELCGTLPGLFTLVEPTDNTTNQPSSVFCSWTSSAGALTYHLEVAFDSSFTSLAVSDSTIQDTVQAVGPLPDSTLFFWRVRAINDVGSTMFTPFRRFTTALSPVHYLMMKSWNLISLPLDVVDGRKPSLFPSAVSNAFGYNPASGYEIRDTLTPHVGYWLNFRDSTTVGLVGTPRYIDTIDVVPGWNMIGSVSQSIPTTQVSSIPGGVVTSQFFGYQRTYVTSNTIDPGKGYWVKVNLSGKLILSSSSMAAGEASAIRIEPISEMPPPPPSYEKVLAKGIPMAYVLEQNYPNPFNPLTVIRYQLPVNSFVSLKIYNVLGQEAATLVNKFEDSGFKSAEWNSSAYSNGVYFYRIEVVPQSGKNPKNSFLQIKKMILIK